MSCITCSWFWGKFFTILSLRDTLIGCVVAIAMQVAFFVFTCVSWPRSEEHTSELQSLMRISYAVFCLKKKKQKTEETQVRIQYNNPIHQKMIKLKLLCYT